MNFSFTIYSLHTKLRAENIHMQKSMSQNFDLDLHYYWMKHIIMSTNILIIFQWIIQNNKSLNQNSETHFPPKGFEESL